MQKCTLLFLHSIDPLVTNWVVFDEEGKILPPTSISDIKDTRTVVLVPAEDVLLTHATLPKLSPQKLQQALPFALEEQLLDDVENLHFAIGPYQANDLWPVAITTKEKMTAWLSALTSIGISPSVLIPLTFALPYTEDSWNIFSHDNISTVRTGEYTGFACDTKNLDTLIELNSAQPVYIDLSSQQLIEIAPQLTKSVPINLLQGSYRAKQTATQTKKIWQLAGIVTAAWIALMFLNPLISFFILHKQTNQIETAISTIYKKNFPQATAVVAPRERMQEKLKTAFASTNKDNFLALLSLLSKSLVDLKSIQLKHLEFREKQLTLEVATDSFDNLDKLTNALTQQGLNVKR